MTPPDPITARWEEIAAQSDFVHQLARRLLRDQEGARDVAQTSLLAALSGRPPLGEGGLRAWLGSVVRRRVARDRRDAVHRQDRERGAARGEALPSAEAVIERERWRRRLLEAVERLPSDQREALLLRFFEGLPPRRIAAHLGQPVDTIKTRLGRGLKRLRNELTETRDPRSSAGLWLLAHASPRAPWSASPTWGPWVGTAMTKGKSLALAAVIVGVAASVWIGSRLLESTPRAAGGREVVPTARVEKPATPEPRASSNAERQELAPAVAAVPPPPAPPGPRVNLRGTVWSWPGGTQGRRLSSMEVLAWTQSPPAGEPAGTVLTRFDGSYDLSLELEGEATVHLEARADGWLAADSLTGQVRAEETRSDLDLHLVPRTAHQFEVVDSSGEPVAAARVECRVQVDPARNATRHQGWMRKPPSAGLFEASTDALGRVRLEDLPALWLTAGVTSASHGDWKGAFDASATTQTRVVLSQGWDLEGLIVDDRGGPVEGAVIELRGDATLARTRSDAQGRFRMADLTRRLRGTRLTVEAEGFAGRIHEPVTEQDAELRLQLERALSIAGTVTLADGSPAVGAFVSVEGGRLVRGPVDRPLWRRPTWEAQFGPTTGRTDEEGRFRFDGLYAGEFLLAVGHEADGTERRLYRRVPAGVDDLRIRLGPEAWNDVVLEGSVRDALSGEPIEAFSVTVLGLLPWPGASDGVEFNSRPQEFRSPDGRFRIGGLEPARLSLFVQAAGYRSAGQSPEDRGPGVHPVEVELLPVRSLALRVVDPEGQPLRARITVAGAEGGLLWLPIDGGSVSSLTTDVDGRVVLGNLPAGPVTVTAQVRGGPSGRFPFDLTVEPDGVQQLVLRPER